MYAGGMKQKKCTQKGNIDYWVLFYLLMVIDAYNTAGYSYDILGNNFLSIFQLDKKQA